MRRCAGDLAPSGSSGPAGAPAGDLVALRSRASAHGCEVREAMPIEYAEIGRVTQAAWREFARPSDALWRAYYRQLADVAGRAARAVVLVAVVGRRVVGTATVELGSTIEGGDSLAGGRANLRMLAVEPLWRGRGIGRLLVDACLERARAAGKEVATLHTVEQMTTATRIYRALGFERDPSADVARSPELTLLAYRLDL